MAIEDLHSRNLRYTAAAIQRVAMYRIRSGAGVGQEDHPQDGAMKVNESIVVLQ
jgi:hypothetical protein